jgi:hypothetical protein
VRQNFLPDESGTICSHRVSHGRCCCSRSIGARANKFLNHQNLDENEHLELHKTEEILFKIAAGESFYNKLLAELDACPPKEQKVGGSNPAQTSIFMKNYLSGAVGNFKCQLPCGKSIQHFIHIKGPAYCNWQLH